MQQNTERLNALIAFRHQLYQSVLGHRKDSLFELMEAALALPGPAPLVQLSLAPVFRRGWPSAPDALADGSLDPQALRGWCVRSLPLPAEGERELWVLDGSTWPRPAASTSPERTYAHRLAPGVPQHGVVPGWEYQWLVVLPEPQGSWALPVDVARRGSQAGPPTSLALAQLGRVLRLRPPTAPRPVVLLDSGYEPVALAQAPQRQQVDFLVRLAKNRVFFAVPAPYRGRGRPARHGPALRLADPRLQPTAQVQADDPEYGQVTVSVWTNLHARRAPAATFSVVRVQVERLPRRAHPPAPLWLAWIGQLPQDLLLLWRWYLRRFRVEHLFRFAKQHLGWTAVRPRAPEAADRWSWLLAAACWQLWLARLLVAQTRLPWERPLPPEQLSPGRVLRAFCSLLPRLGTPARAPKPRGKSPGRRAGHKPGRRKRYSVALRTSRHVA
jgi:hypothetical protein